MHDRDRPTATILGPDPLTDACLVSGIAAAAPTATATQRSAARTLGHLHACRDYQGRFNVTATLRGLFSMPMLRGLWRTGGRGNV